MKYLVAIILLGCTSTLHTQPFLKFSKWDGKQWTAYAAGAHGIEGSGYLAAMVVDSVGRIFAGGSYLPWGPFEWTGSDWRYCDASPYKFGRRYFGLLTQDSLNNVYSTSNYADTSDVNPANWKVYTSVVRWTGSEWTVVGAPLRSEMYTATYDASFAGTLCCDRKNVVYAEIDNFFGNGQSGFFRYSGTKWDTLSSAALSVFRLSECMISDSHNNIFITGFPSDTNAAIGMMKWDGSSWSPVGFDGTFTMHRLHSQYESGSFEIDVDEHDNIYLTSGFTNEHGLCYVAKWDGTTWSELGPPDFFQSVSVFNATVVLNSHTIYVSMFDESGEGYIYLFDGTSWSRRWHSVDPQTDGFIAADKYGAIYFAADIPIADAISYDVPLSSQLYPNPCSDRFTMELPDANHGWTLQLYNELGALTKYVVVQPGARTAQCSVQTLPSGSYTLIVSDESGRYCESKQIRVLH